MGDAERKPPAFFCPECGQKHRADLQPLEERPGAVAGIHCRRCNAALSLRVENGKPLCEVAAPEESEESEKPAPAQAPVSTPPALPATPQHEPYDASLSDRPLEAGKHAGRYVIKGVVRKGLTSTVYRVHDPTTKRAVGMKVLGARAPSEVRDRFLRQVDVQARIRHPSILPVYDRGALEDGRPFMTMELLHRPLSLSDLLERRASGKLERQHALAPLADLDALIDRVLVPVADGIYVANIESGVVHGDLRPENILIDGQTLRPYVVDFGRACNVRGESGAEVVAMPSTHYLSPEQARGTIHGRTDVWGLGALLHGMITGAPPLEGSGDALRRAAADGRYAALPESAPPALRAVVQKAMALAPEDRYVNARQMTADLKAWRHGGRVRALDEFGGPGASVEEKKKALREHLRTVGWVAAGLLVGLLVGSRIHLGGEDPQEVRIAGVEALVDRLDHEVAELAEQIQYEPQDLGYAPFVRATAPAEACGIWRRMNDRADALQAELQRTPPSPTRRSLQARVAFIRGRLTPAPVLIDAPEGTRIEAVNVTTADRIHLAPGLATIPPGQWDVRIGEGDRARVPVCIPLSVRPPGVGADTVEPWARWSIPVPPSSLRASSVLVVGGSVPMNSLPLGVPRETAEVSTFAIDRRLVTNAEYARFLGGIPEAERAARAPATGLELSRARTWRPVSGAGRLPVAGIRPGDARAYCAWASVQEDATLRLPTEAEWILASGALCSPWARGDLTTVEAHSPYGVQPLPEGMSEMVAGRGTVIGDEGTTFAKGGAHENGAGSEEGLRFYTATRLDEDARTEGIGFRCVQVLPPNEG